MIINGIVSLIAFVIYLSMCLHIGKMLPNEVFKRNEYSSIFIQILQLIPESITKEETYYSLRQKEYIGT